MKQIKTITKRRDRETDFDRQVNQALSEGWQIRDLFLAPAADTSSLSYHPIWVAFLDREVPDAE